MAIPPQFLANIKKKQAGKGKLPGNAAEDAKDGGKDDAQETPVKKAHHKAKTDAIKNLTKKKG